MNQSSKLGNDDTAVQIYWHNRIGGRGGVVENVIMISTKVTPSQFGIHCLYDLD